MAKNRHTNEDEYDSEIAEKTTAQVGKFLGMDLDPSLRTAMNVVVGRMLPELRPKAETVARSATKLFLQKINRPDLAPKAGDIVSSVVGYGIAVLPQALGFFSTAQEYWKTLSETNKKFSLVSSEGRKNNFIIDEERENSFRSVKLSFKENLGELVNAAPQIYDKVITDKLNKAYSPIQQKIDQLYDENKPNGYVYESQEKYLRNQIELQLKNDPGELADAFTQSSELAKKSEGVQDFVKNYGTTVVTPLATHLIQKSIRDKHNQSSKQSIYSMIEELAAKVKNEPGARSYHLWGEQRTLTDAIQVLFAETHKRKYKTKVELSGQALEDMSTQIATVIETGELKPMELVALIGQNALVKNKSGELASPEEIEKALDETIKRTTKEHPINTKEQIASLGLTEDDVKNIFKDAKDNPEQLALLAAITPIHVTMQQTGLKKKDVRNLIRKTHNKIMADVEDAFLELSSKSVDELKELGFSKKEANDMQSIAIRAEEEGREIISQSIGNDKNPGIEKYVLKALSKGAELGTWTKRVNGERTEAEVSESLGNLGKAVDEEDKKSRKSTHHGVKSKGKSHRHAVEETDTAERER
jgi:hypothetical protein